MLVDAAHGVVTDSEKEILVDAAHDLEKEMLGKTKIHNIRFSDVLCLLQDNISTDLNMTLITPFAEEPLSSINLSRQGKLELSLRFAELLIVRIRGKRINARKDTPLIDSYLLANSQ